MDVQHMLETALPLLEEWQRHTANNIANVDTPGYQAQQVDFRASLRSALAGRRPRLSMTRTDPGHLGQGSTIPGLVITASKTTALRTDGNTVDLDYEMTQLARNPYRTVSEILKNRNRLVREVLRAR